MNGLPIILYDNRFADATPVASSTAVGDYHVLNLRDWRNFTWWKPASVPATVTVDRADSSYLRLPGQAGNYASTPDSAALDITGSIDVRIRCGIDWIVGPGKFPNLVTKDDPPSQRSWSLYIIGVTGRIEFFYTADGTTQRIATSTVPIGLQNGAVTWIRCTYNATNGEVKFYLSDDGASWSQLGSTVTITAGNIFVSTAPLRVSRPGSGEVPRGKVFYAEVRNGIDGTVVAKWEPTQGKTGDTSITSTTGEVWTIVQSGSPRAELVSPSVDYWCIYGHDLGTNGCTVELRRSTDNFAASDVLVDSVTPDDDAPILRLVSSANARYWRLRVVNGTAPTLAIAAAGQKLEFPRRLLQPFDPLAHTARGQANESETGNPLGAVDAYDEWQQDIELRHIDAAWVRDSFRPAWLAHLKNQPFVFAWDPVDHISELYYCHPVRAYRAPSGPGQFVDFGLNLRGKFEW